MGDLTVARQGVVKLCQVAEAKKSKWPNGTKFNKITMDKWTVKTFLKRSILNNVL